MAKYDRTVAHDQTAVRGARLALEHDRTATACDVLVDEPSAQDHGLADERRALEPQGLLDMGLFEPGATLVVVDVDPVALEVDLHQLVGEQRGMPDWAAEGRRREVPGGVVVLCEGEGLDARLVNDKLARAKVLGNIDELEAVLLAGDRVPLLVLLHGHARQLPSRALNCPARRAASRADRVWRSA
jgi:hypothetical protein